MNLKIWKDIYE